jgi:hypothetical protein
VEIVNDDPNVGVPGPLVKIPGVYVWGQPGMVELYLHLIWDASISKADADSDV